MFCVHKECTHYAIMPCEEIRIIRHMQLFSIAASPEERLSLPSLKDISDRLAAIYVRNTETLEVEMADLRRPGESLFMHMAAAAARQMERYSEPYGHVEKAWDALQGVPMHGDAIPDLKIADVDAIRTLLLSTGYKTQAGMLATYKKKIGLNPPSWGPGL